MKFIYSVQVIVACSTAYKWVTASTEGIRPKVILMNKCANIPIRKMFVPV